MTSAIAKDDRYVQTASNESSLLQVADTTLGEVVKQLTSALSLAVQGNSGTLNASNLATVTQQLSGIRDQVLSLANTSYQGQYLFSGSQGSVNPSPSIPQPLLPPPLTTATPACKALKLPTGRRFRSTSPAPTSSVEPPEPSPH